MSIKALCLTEDPDRPTMATLAGLEEKGIDVTVMLPPVEKARNILDDAGVAIRDFPFSKRSDPGGVAALRADLEQGNFDILHLFSNKALQNGLRAARGLPVRVIAYRGIVGNVSFLNPVDWRRILNPRIDRIVCVADAVRDYFLHMQPAFLRIPEEKIVRIYKGHSLDWYTAGPADLTALGIPSDAFVLSCVANYRPRKGIEVLVDAIGRLPSEWPVHLMLVGHMDASRLDRAIQNSPARDRIHRVGHRADAPSLTAASDLFVLPSTRREGLARSLIEAMAYGIAPVVTDCGGSPELVINGQTGLVVPVRDAAALANAISVLYEGEDMRRRFGDAARERIRNDFRIEDTIEQTYAMYRELAGRNG